MYLNKHVLALKIIYPQLLEGIKYAWVSGFFIISIASFSPLLTHVKVTEILHIKFYKKMYEAWKNKRKIRKYFSQSGINQTLINFNILSILKLTNLQTCEVLFGELCIKLLLSEFSDSAFLHPLGCAIFYRTKKPSTHISIGIRCH